jgi:hypothetical protein
MTAGRRYHYLSATSFIVGDIMANLRELASVAKPVLSAAANLIAALDEQKAGRSGNAMFLRCGSDLFDAVGQTYALITAATSNGKALAPSYPNMDFRLDRC